MLRAAAAAGGELGVAAVAEASEGVFVLAVGAAQVSGGLHGVAGAVVMFGPAGTESEFADGAAGGFAGGRVGLAAIAVFVVGAVASTVSGSGGVEDLILSLSEGDAALTSSTGLFYKKDKEINIRSVHFS